MMFAVCSLSAPRLLLCVSYGLWMAFLVVHILVQFWPAYVRFPVNFAKIRQCSKILLLLDWRTDKRVIDFRRR